MRNCLNSHFFVKMDQCQPGPNRESQRLWVKGIRIVPNSHTLAGFAIGTLCLATMATIQAPFKDTTQNQNLFLQKDFYFPPTQAQKNHIYLNLVFMATLLNVIYAKIMGKIRGESTFVYGEFCLQISV